MADEKKPASSNIGWELAGFLLLLYFLSLIVEQAQYYIHLWGYGTITTVWGGFIGWMIRHVKPIFIGFGIVASIGAVWVTILSGRRFRKLVSEEAKIYGEGARVSTTLEGEKPAPSNPHWERVIEHINSTNSSDWRLSIIEADVILDDVLKSKGYHGDSLGERLKSVDKSDMLTLDAAWEAHKVRNQVAHQGADFNLSERDAKHVIALYESVFKEAKVI